MNTETGICSSLPFLWGLTQKELGIKLGFDEKSADVRIAQYESGTRTPKAELLSEIANISLDAFVKIMTNKTLRSSDCSKTNDSEEIKWLTGSAQKYVEEYILADDKLCEHIKMDDSKKTITRNKVDAVINGVFFKNSRMMFTLVTCFSEAKDLLSQWRGYANDGNGIAIGFSKEHLMTFDSGGYKYHFKKIEYDEELQFNCVKKTLDNLIYSYKTSEFQENIFEEFYKICYYTFHV